jgi:hypothetical protein
MLTLSEVRAQDSGFGQQCVSNAVKILQSAMMTARDRVRAFERESSVACTLPTADNTLRVMYNPVEFTWVVTGMDEKKNPCLQKVYEALQTAMAALGWLTYKYSDSDAVYIAPADNLENVWDFLYSDLVIGPALDAMLDAVQISREDANTILDEYMRSLSYEDEDYNLVTAIQQHRTFRAYPSALRSEFLWAIVSN